MQCLIKLIALGGLLLVTNSSLAQEVKFCHATKEISNNYEPAIFNTNNNLLRQAGHHPVYCGERILVQGQVVDQFCKPIMDAKVYLWQANCAGQYPYQLLKNLADHELVDSESEQSFQGNGIASTDNVGSFNFITIYPHPMHGLAPHLNFKVEHPDFAPLQTRFILQQIKPTTSMINLPNELDVAIPTYQLTIVLTRPL